MLFYILLIFNVILSFPVWAAGDVLWQSPVLDKPIINMRLGSYTKSDAKEVALLMADGFEIQELADKNLKLVSNVHWSKKFEPVRLNKFDFLDDKKDELIVTGFEYGRVQTKIYQFNESKWILLGQYPYYIQVISERGKQILIGQKLFAQEDYSGSPFLINVQGTQLSEGNPLFAKKGLSTKNISLYDVLSFDDQNSSKWMILDATGVPYIYDVNPSMVRLGGGGDSFNGSVYHIDREIRNELSELQASYFEIPQRIVFNQGETTLASIESQSSESTICDERDPGFWHVPCIVIDQSIRQIETTKTNPRFYLIRSQDYLKNVVGSRPAIKNARIVALEWNGHSLQESWASSLFDGGIADFDFIQWTNDDKPELLLVNTIRSKGYWQTQKEFRSQLVVIGI